MKLDVSQFGAAGLALAAYSCWVLVDTCLKVIGASRLPAYEVIAIVGFAEVLILLAYQSLRGDVRLLWPRRPASQMLRSCLDVANNVFVVVALRHLPLALFYILIFFAPVVTTLFAAFLLGESLEWRKGAAVLTGFAGVAIAVHRSGSASHGDWTGYLACLVCVLCFSTNLLWSRVLTQTEAPESLTFSSGLMMAIFGAVASSRGAEPLTLKLSAFLGIAAVFSVVGSLCFFVALRHSFAANVSQYHYSQLVTGALIAFVFWHERPTLAMIFGAVLIIASGSYAATLSYLVVPKASALRPERGEA